MKPNEITNIKGEVERLLREEPKYRDSDTLLWARIVQDYLGGFEMLRAMSAYELLRKFTKGELPSYESVSRARRLVQQDNEELRGTAYHERQKKTEDIAKELGYRLPI